MALPAIGSIVVGSIAVLGLTGALTSWATAKDLGDFGGKVGFGGVGVAISVLRDAPQNIQDGLSGSPKDNGPLQEPDMPGPL